jgi:hypothetical protein
MPVCFCVLGLCISIDCHLLANSELFRRLGEFEVMPSLSGRVRLYSAAEGTGEILGETEIRALLSDGFVAHPVGTPASNIVCGGVRLAPHTDVYFTLWGVRPHVYDYTVVINVSDNCSILHAFGYVDAGPSL